MRHWSRLVAVFGLSWWVCVGAAQNLLPLNPRYFMITSSMACLLAGLAIGRLWMAGGRRQRMLAAGAALALIGSNLAGIYVENKDPVAGEKALADFVERHPTITLTTDPATRYRAAMLLRWNGGEARVADVPPASGALYYHNPARSGAPGGNAGSGLARLSAATQLDFGPTLRTPPSYLARALEALGLARRSPARTVAQTSLPPSTFGALSSALRGRTGQSCQAQLVPRPSSPAANLLGIARRDGKDASPRSGRPKPPVPIRSLQGKPI